MFATITHKGCTYKTDLLQPIDISIPMSDRSARAWYVDPLRIEPARTENWIGEVKSGGSVNFRNIFLIHMVTEHIQNASVIYLQK